MENRKGGFFWICSRTADLVVLGMVCIITSLPVVTMVPSFSAMYYAVCKSIRHGEGKPVREYMRSWKMNIRQGLAGNLIYLALGYTLYVSLRVTAGTAAIWAELLFAGILVMSMVYYSAVLSRFSVNAGQCFRISLFLLIRYFGRTAVLAGTFLLCVLTCLILPPSFPVVFPLWFLYSTFLIEPIFQNYMNLGEYDRDMWYAGSSAGEQ